VPRSKPSTIVPSPAATARRFVVKVGRPDGFTVDQVTPSSSERTSVRSVDWPSAATIVVPNEAAEPWNRPRPRSLATSVHDAPPSTER
jgi:hypothetical protein